MRRKLRLSVIVSLTSLLFTFQLWNLYFNSPDKFDNGVAANTILGMGILFSIAAGLFAWSIESRNEFLEKEVKQKIQELLQKNTESRKAESAVAAIYQVGHFLFSDMNPETLFEKIMDLSTQVLGADEGTIMLLDSTRHLTIAASRGIPENIANQVRLRIGERVAGRVAELRREVLIVDGLENYPEFKGVQSNPRIRSSIVCPLICQEELLGVLSLNSTTKRENFTVADLLSVSIFAAQAAQAIHNSSIYRALELKITQLEESNKRIRDLEQGLGS